MNIIIMMKTFSLDDFSWSQRIMNAFNSGLYFSSYMLQVHQIHQIYLERPV